MRPLAKLEKKPYGNPDGNIDPLRSDEQQEELIRQFMDEVCSMIPAQAHGILFMQQSEGQVTAVLNLSHQEQKYDIRATSNYIQSAIEVLRNKVQLTDLFPEKKAPRPRKDFGPEPTV